MSNDIHDEVNKITKTLININNSNDSFNKLVYSLIDDKFKKDEIKIIFLVTKQLANEGYYIESIKPFKLKKDN